MCYLAREPRAEPERGAATPSPGSHGLRPRWIGAAAATLIGGLTMAALVIPPSEPPLAKSETAAPIAAKASVVPTAGVVEQTSVTVDDGVPTRSDVVKAGAGHCEHGM